jgi:hypothetical protein
MYTNCVKPARGQCYYRCASRLHNGPDVCSVSKNYRADEVEPAVWGLVSDLLKDPDLVRAGLEEMIRQEREGLRGDPDKEAKTWSLKLAEVDNMRAGYQEMAAKGLMTFEELGARLKELDDRRETAEREMKALQSRKKRIEELERDREELLASYMGAVPQALDITEPETRYRIYKLLRLSVTAQPDRSVTVSGVLGNSINVSNPETASSSS